MNISVPKITSIMMNSESLKNQQIKYLKFEMMNLEKKLQEKEKQIELFAELLLEFDENKTFFQTINLN